MGIKNNTYICGGLMMPEVFRFYGFSFFFYSREHEPLHIHVEGNGGKLVFQWNGEEFTVKERVKIKTSDFRRIKAVIDENAEIIQKRWMDYFKDVDNDNRKDLVR